MRTRPVLGIVALIFLMVGCAPAAGPPAPAIQTRKTVGRTTQNVLDFSKAIAEGGVLAETSVSSGGFEATSDAYKASIGKLAGIAVAQKMHLHQAEQGSDPETYEDFVAKIIEPGRPNGLHLPMLPYYQEYAYDPERKALVVVEFPARKQQRQGETAGAAGL
jgi:hypothetical protein